MWSVLFGGTVPWVAAIATLLLVLAATLLIIHQVRASDGDMSVRLRWLGLHVQRSAPSRTPGTLSTGSSSRSGGRRSVPGPSHGRS
jgi:hypothetical protein